MLNKASKTTSRKHIKKKHIRTPRKNIQNKKKPKNETNKDNAYKTMRPKKYCFCLSFDFFSLF